MVYSIDEVFMDVTDYLNSYKLSAHDLAMKIILDVLETTGITATAGIGTNLFLCKVAMDIVAKHIPADKNGVRIAELDEMKFRRELWSHQLSRTSGAWVGALPRNLSRTGCSRWVMLPSVQSGTRTCFTSCSARMRNCSLTMRGDGNRPPLKQSKRTVQLQQPQLRSGIALSL